MNQPRIQTLEDNPIGFCPEASRPVLCECCVDVLHGHGQTHTHIRSMRALRTSSNSYSVIDYASTSWERCHCCQTTAHGARYYVYVTRKTC